MKICFISHTSRNAGAERVLLETLDILQTEGIECRVLVPEPGELCRLLADLGVPFSIIPYPTWMARGRPGFLTTVRRALNIAVKTIAVAKTIARWRCDIVYSNTVTIPEGALASLLLGLPHVWHLHEFGKEDHGLSLLFGDRLSYKLVEWLSKRCVCVSKALADKYSRSVDPSKLSILYPSMHMAPRNVADPARDCSMFPCEAKFRCVIVGRMCVGKGQADGVLALSHLRKNGIEAELIIVGDGDQDYRNFLDETIRSNDLERQVFFVGQVSDPFSIVQSGDVVLVCSKSEAFGRVTIEGMLAGKPVVGARSGATAELIVDGVNGLFYECGESEDLAEKIKYLSENPALREELGKNARAAAESYFTAARYKEQLLGFLRQISNN
jgi:glycosyltransferase involved in cell wall biosynthesis